MRSTFSNRHIWKIAYPIILGSIAQNIISVTDTAFLGRVGETALAASAIGGVFYLVMVMIGFGFGIGTQIVIARRDGEGKQKEIGPTLEHAMLFLAGLAILLTAAYGFFGKGLMGAILQSDAVMAETQKYLGIRSWGIILAFIQVAFRSFFVGIGHTAVITRVTIVMAVVNVVLDYVLIFGKFGFPEMGIRGAALASLIAEVAGTIQLFIYTFRRIDYRKYHLFKLSPFDGVMFKRLLSTSTPMMIQHFVSLGSWFVFFLMVEKMGEHDLAVSQIMRSVYILVLLPLWGFAATTNTLVSNLLGQGKTDEVFPLIVKVLKLCLGVMLPFVAVSVAFPEVMVRIYTSDVAMIADSARVLVIISPAALVLALAFVVFSAVSGTGKTMVSLIIEIVVLSLYMLATFLIVKLWKAPIEVVWTVEYVYGAFLALFSWIYLRRGKWTEAKV
jgi:putative MATE family efflux protein